MSQPKKVSIRDFFVKKVSSVEVKEKIVKQIPKKKKQDVFDDRIQIAKSSLNIKNKVNEVNQNQNQIFQQIQKLLQSKRQSALLVCKTAENLSKNQIKKDEGKKQAQQQLLQPKQKPKPKFRAKIFKQQLISSLPLQTPTSLARWTYGQGTTSSKLVIGNWNVNGIRSILSKKMLYPYIYSHKPDIICITQTKMDEKGFNLAPIALDGYRGYWNFPKHASGYSGVVVFSKYLPKSATEDLLQRQHSQQGRILTLQFQRFTLINIYVPTVGKDLQRIQYRKKYDLAFRDHVLRLRTANPNKPLFIVGDLNVAHSELDTHPGKQIMLTPSFTNIERQGLTELLGLGFSDVFRVLHPQVRAYTWWYVNIGGRDRLDTPGLGRRIDYFLVPKQNMKGVKRCDILREYYGADHCPLEMEIDLDLMQS